MSQQQLLTADELAECLKVRPGTVRQWSRRGLIPAVRLTPKVVRYEFESVVNALKTRQDAQGGNDDK